MSQQATANYEEAANVAAEFIYSIDNLPHEVSHILQEIKHCDNRTQELQQEIEKDSTKYIRHSRRSTSTSSSSPSSPSPKSSSLPARITASYTEIQTLTQEKCQLAERLIQIITRTRSKLDVELTKVMTLQGDSPETISATITAASKPPTTLPQQQPQLTMNGNSNMEGLGAPGKNPALAISESLRNALAMAPLPAVSVAAAAAAPSPPANKKRRLTTATSIKISPATTPTKHRSASPTTVSAPTAHVQQKSRLSRQVRIPVVEDNNDEEEEAEEGEEEMEEEEEDAEDDKTLYCFCQKTSYGDMIACDNEGGCPFEWFHLDCVGLKQPTPDKWYCSVCTKEKGLVSSTTTTTTTSSRKGRKK
ncbi:hypothetical protein D9613_009709 [Agrocybe pediades]|uniref:Chromatin modification-related protein n=1 Tax=Agrocybe pediades TaxID=84607 RepID=A0A8H4QW58_9AGAR|nr:hypothetical protein D9613_009709 [Agrocybe pediades]